MIKNEIFQSHPTRPHPADECREVGIRLIFTALFFNSTRPARPAIEHFVKRPIIIDSIFTSKKTLVHLFSVGCHAEEGTILLHPHQETLRTRRTSQIVNLIAQWLTDKGFVGPGRVQIKLLHTNRIGLTLNTKMMLGVEVEFVALLRQTG